MRANRWEDSTKFFYLWLRISPIHSPVVSGVFCLNYWKEREIIFSFKSNYLGLSDWKQTILSCCVVQVFNIRVSCAGRKRRGSVLGSLVAPLFITLLGGKFPSYRQYTALPHRLHPLLCVAGKGMAKQWWDRPFGTKQWHSPTLHWTMRYRPKRDQKVVSSSTGISAKAWSLHG